MNTHPSTPFGIAFDKMGLWHYHFEHGIVGLYDKLHDSEKAAVKGASKWIAIINENLDVVPTSVFALIQQHFPEVSAASIADTLNTLNASIFKVDAAIPQDAIGAIATLQAYLKAHEGVAWIAITKAIVTVLTDIFLKGQSPVAAIGAVLDYVYLTFIKK